MSTVDEATGLARFQRLHEATAATMDARVRAHQAAISADETVKADGPIRLNLLADGDS